MATRQLSPSELDLLRRVREAVQAIEPEAEIILYGSRARGDAETDSDWDLLVLLEGPVNRERRSAVRRPIYAIEREAGEVLTVMVRNCREWDSGPWRLTPLHANVAREGIAI